MKKIIVELALVLAYAVTAMPTVIAQDGFSYQSVIRKSDGTLVSNANVGMRFTLYDDTVKCYQESQSVKTNAYGVASVVVGGDDAKVLSGDFSSVPWNSMKVKMEVEADINGGGSYISYGKIQIQPVPYAMYAKSAFTSSEIVAGSNTTEDDELFSVKDKDGNVVFAVYPSGVKVYVDVTDSNKAMSRGFAISERKSATKDEGIDLLVIDETGTRIYVDADDSKAMSRGFAISERKASKAEESDNVFVVDGKGTLVYIDADSSKAMSRGFAISERKASKDDSVDDLFVTDANGTHVYVDSDSSKAMSRGFAISERKASKDAESDNVFVVDNTGTQVYIDADSSKAMSRGFAISERKASKGDNDNLLVVDAKGTQVYIDVDSSKAMSRGFAISERKAATKDAEIDNIFIVDAAGTQAFIDDDGSKAMSRGFAISGRNLTKDNPFNGDYLSISDTMTLLGVNGSNEAPSLSIVDRGSVDTIAFVSEDVLNIKTDMKVNGDIEYHDYVNHRVNNVDVVWRYSKDGFPFTRLRIVNLLGLDETASVEFADTAVINGTLTIKDENGNELILGLDTRGELNIIRGTLQSDSFAGSFAVKSRVGYDVTITNINFQCRIVDGFNENVVVPCYVNADGEYKGIWGQALPMLLGDIPEGINSWAIETFDSNFGVIIENDSLKVNYSLKDASEYANKKVPIILNGYDKERKYTYLLNVSCFPVDYVDLYIPYSDEEAVDVDFNDYYNEFDLTYGVWKPSNVNGTISFQPGMDPVITECRLMSNDVIIGDVVFNVKFISINEEYVNSANAYFDSDESNIPYEIDLSQIFGIGNKWSCKTENYGDFIFDMKNDSVLRVTYNSSINLVDDVAASVLLYNEEGDPFMLNVNCIHVDEFKGYFYQLLDYVADGSINANLELYGQILGAYYEEYDWHLDRTSGDATGTQSGEYWVSSNDVSYTLTNERMLKINKPTGVKRGYLDKLILVGYHEDEICVLELYLYL